MKIIITIDGVSYDDLTEASCDVENCVQDCIAEVVGPDNSFETEIEIED